jgi:hypothetical protein
MLNAARVETVKFGVRVMHDCRKLENSLVDLVFDELDTDEKQCLLAEVESCVGCLREYRSMTETLLVFDQSVEASSPDESFWPQHHAALRQRLEIGALPAKTKRTSLWKRLLTAKLPVPVPVAAVIAIMLLTSSVIALRQSKVEVISPTSQTLSANTTTPEIIEVPVIREKIVTRTVYVEKRERQNTRALPQATVAPRDEYSLTARNSLRESGQGNLFTHVNLTDFQPPDEIKIRIIKRRNTDEK